MAQETAARHARNVTEGVGPLAWRFFVKLKWQYLPLLLSDYTREILRRKYDAIATDRAYENRASGILWPVGHALDRAVLNFPVHAALRQRLQIVTGLIEEETLRHAEHSATVRLLSAPCGLARDVITSAQRLSQEHSLGAGRLELFGLDLDASGEVLPLAGHRARSSGVDLRLARADLFNAADVGSTVGPTRFHVVNSIGLTAWVDIGEVALLARTFHGVMTPGGSLIVDNWAKTKHSSIAEDLQIYAVNHDPGEFVETVTQEGFELDRSLSTNKSVATVFVFRRKGD